MIAILCVVLYEQPVTAETTVHTERSYNKPSSNKKDFRKKNQTQTDTEKTKKQDEGQINNEPVIDESVKDSGKIESNKESLTEPEKEIAPKIDNTIIGDAPDNIPHKIDVIEDDSTLLNNNDIFAGTYFANFNLVGPKTYTYFGDAGDMAGLSSVIRFSSYFKLTSPNQEETCEVTLLKRRIAWALGVNTEYNFFLNYTLDCQPIVSDKKHPKIEFNKNGKITEREINNLFQYGSNMFLIIFSDEKKVTDIINSGADISILLPVLNGDYVKVPILKKRFNNGKRL